MRRQTNCRSVYPTGTHLDFHCGILQPMLTGLDRAFNLLQTNSFSLLRVMLVVWSSTTLRTSVAILQIRRTLVTSMLQPLLPRPPREFKVIQTIQEALSFYTAPLQISAPMLLVVLNTQESSLQPTQALRLPSRLGYRTLRNRTP